MKTIFKKLPSKCFFYVAWALMVVHICVASSSYAGYSVQYVSYIAALLLGLKIILTKYSLKEVLVMSVVIAVGLASAYISTDMRTLWFALFVVGCKDIEIDKIIKLTFRTLLICCIVFILLSVLGFAQLYGFSDSKDRIVLSLGMGGPNMVSAFYGIMVSLYIYLNYKRIKTKHIVGFSIGAVLVFVATMCKTGLIVFVAEMFIVLMLKSKQLKNKPIFRRKCAIAALLVMLFFTVVPILYNKELFGIANDILTGRLEQANFYVDKYGINLLGNNAFADLDNRWSFNVLDDGYARMLVVNGILYYLMIMAIIANNIKIGIKERRDELLVVMMFFLLYLCVENFATYIFLNPFLLLASDMMFGQFTTKKIGGKV